MSAKLEAYRKTAQKPEKHLVWELRGAGLENFGQGGRPVAEPVPECGPRQILARVDALGLCYSDVKIIHQGGDHPRFKNRDLAEDPVVIGHEVSVTVAEVGEELRERYRPGQRLVVQPDAYLKGEQISYGYHLRGGAAQYTILDESLHSGDDGSYLIPVYRAETGYSEAALTEPWACVERAYHLRSRPGLKPRGITWFVGLAAGDLYNYMLGEGFDYRGGPRRVFLTEVVGPVASSVRRHAELLGIRIEETAPLPSFLSSVEERRNLRFDDIVVLGKPRKNLVERLVERLAPRGHLALVCPEIIEGRAKIDIGRIHYDYLHIVGTASWVAMDAYRSRRSSILTESGAAWFVGAGGPMGQMHLQRVLQRKNTPRLIMCTDVDEARLDRIKDLFEERAMRSGCRFVVLHAREATRRMINQVTDGEGFTHVILLAARHELAEEAWPYLGERGILNVFAGLARGTKAALRPSLFCTKGCRIVGSTGSSIEDLRYILSETEAGRHSADSAVAAIGGIGAVRQGLQAVAEGSYPGKVVIYPQFDFPLTGIENLGDKFPQAAKKLGEKNVWNRQAEAALLESLLE